MMIDGELAKKCLPIPVAAENHDYWITLVASGTNAQIFHLQQPLMLYRQHSSNVTGSVKDHYIVPRIKRFLFSFDRLKKNERRKVLMLESLYTHLDQDLAPQNRELLKGYLSVLEKSWTQIVRFCIQHKIKRQSVLSTVVLYTVLSKLYQSKNSEK